MSGGAGSISGGTWSMSGGTWSMIVNLLSRFPSSNHGEGKS